MKSSPKKWHYTVSSAFLLSLPIYAAALSAYSPTNAPLNFGEYIDGSLSGVGPINKPMSLFDIYDNEVAKTYTDKIGRFGFDDLAITEGKGSRYRVYSPTQDCYCEAIQLSQSKPYKYLGQFTCDKNDEIPLPSTKTRNYQEKPRQSARYSRSNNRYSRTGGVNSSRFNYGSIYDNYGSIYDNYGSIYNGYGSRSRNSKDRYNSGFGYGVMPYRYSSRSSYRPRATPALIPFQPTYGVATREITPMATPYRPAYRSTDNRLSLLSGSYLPRNYRSPVASNKRPTWRKPVINTAPVNTAPVNTAPVNTAPVNTAPVNRVSRTVFVNKVVTAWLIFKRLFS